MSSTHQTSWLRALTTSKFLNSHPLVAKFFLARPFGLVVALSELKFGAGVPCSETRGIVFRDKGIVL